MTWPPLVWIRYNFLHSFTAIAQYNSPADKSGQVSTVSFLLSRHGNHETAISMLHEGSLLFLDGPYGQEVDLAKDDILILAAKGMGIAGVLPMVTDLALRRDHDNRIRERIHDLTERLRTEGNNEALLKEIAYVKAMRLFRDATKKVILFWSLECNSQMEWVEKQLKWLQEMDPQNKLLAVWCRYPDLRTGHDPFELGSRFWMCLDSSATPSFEKLIPIKLKEERLRMAGRMTVFACGDAYFTALMRDGTIKILKDKPVTFLESEYQSRSLEWAQWKDPTMGTYGKGRSCEGMPLRASEYGQ
ncbi:hypothetical protein E5D57_013204 [Metarhizium anisopliae]|nr:hypothetical protein E5D57_013204 [Metarhizium anisopliae]